MNDLKRKEKKVKKYFPKGMNSRSLFLVYYRFVRFALGAFGRKSSLHSEGPCIAAEHWERRGREWDTQ